MRPLNIHGARGEREAGLECGFEDLGKEKNHCLLERCDVNPRASTFLVEREDTKIYEFYFPLYV